MKQRVCIMYRMTEHVRLDLALCRERTHEYRWEIVSEIKIPFISRAEAERKMLRLARRKKFDILMVSDLECLGTMRDMLRISGVLNEMGIELYRVK